MANLRIQFVVTATIFILLFLISQALTVFCSPGNAEVSRTKNLQYFEMTQPVHPPGDAHVSRTKNLQYFELVPPIHPPGNAFVTRTKNLQYFEMTPLLYQYKINITRLVTTDQDGNPCNSFLPGDLVQFDIAIENVGAPESMSLTNGLLAITVLNPKQNVAFLSYTYINLPKGAGLKFVFGYGIPISAYAGMYTVKVMVLSDWPSRGGIGITSKSSTFNIR